MSRSFALVLACVAVALLAAYVTRGSMSGPEISPLEIAWAPTGLDLAFTRQPAGPGAVRLSAASGERTLTTSSADGAHHTLEVRGLLPGQRVTATPLAGTHAGAAVVLATRGSAFADLAEHEEADGRVRVTFRTALPARCRLQIRGARGDEWLGWEGGAVTDHALAVTAAYAPFLGPIAVELQAGDEVRVETIVPTPATRTARRLRLTDELAPRAGRALQEVKRRIIALEKKLQPGPPAELPPLPAWLADELAGPDGALDDPSLPPRRKDELYRVLLNMGDADRSRPLADRTGWHLLPRARHFGTSRNASYPGAMRLPLRTIERNLNAPVTLWNTVAIKFAPDDVRAQLATLKWPHELSGDFELDRLGLDARVELHVKANLPGNRALEVTINDLYLLRLNDPEATPGGPIELFAAFDPAYLVTGSNRIVVRDYLGVADPDPTATTILEPPGIELWVKP